MNYELIFKKKGAANDDGLDDILNRFDAQCIEPHIWHFSSDKPFRDIVFKISRKMGSGFRYCIIALDGAEDDPIPKDHWTNDDHLRFCIHRLQVAAESDFHTLRVTARQNLGHP